MSVYASQRSESKADFVPLINRWDYRMKNRSKNSETFSLLREIRENFYNKEGDECIN